MRSKRRNWSGLPIHSTGHFRAGRLPWAYGIRLWKKLNSSFIMVSSICWLSPIIMRLGNLVGSQRWTLSICFLRKSFGRQTWWMQMWKPHNVPEPCKWGSKKINTTLYPFLVLRFCMECREHYQIFPAQRKSFPWCQEQWAPGKASFSSSPIGSGSQGRAQLSARLKHGAAACCSGGLSSKASQYREERRSTHVRTRSLLGENGGYVLMGSIAEVWYQEQSTLENQEVSKSISTPSFSFGPNPRCGHIRSVFSF